MVDVDRHSLDVKVPERKKAAASAFDRSATSFSL